MIDAGKAYNAANKQFVSGIRELAQQSTKDEVIEVNKWKCDHNHNYQHFTYFLHNLYILEKFLGAPEELIKRHQNFPFYILLPHFPIYLQCL